MKIQVRDGLPFISVTLTHSFQQLTLRNVLLDTGSAGTLFSADSLLEIDIKLEPEDAIRRIYGIDGAEFVFIKQIDSLAVGKIKVNHFPIEIGAMSYGFEIEGILGMDFLLQTKAKINLARLTLL